VFYHLAEFLLGRRTHGLFPEFGRVRLDIVPSDAVASAIAWSARAQEAAGRILHLCAGPHEAIAIERLQEAVRTSAGRFGMALPAVRAVPRWTFRVAARALALVVDAPTRRALATLPVFLDYLESDQLFENAQTSRLLHGAGVEVPPLDEYLPRVLDFYFSGRAAQKKKA